MGNSPKVSRRSKRPHKTIAIFREDGTYRYYDYPPKEYYNGTYTYEESTKTLSMRSDDVDYSDGSDPQVCHAEVTTTRMTWTYPAHRRRAVANCTVFMCGGKRH